MNSALTRHRQTVLEVVQSVKDHPTARQVYERSLKKDPRLSMATVYNSLNFLTEGGYIRRVVSGEEGARFDGIVERHDHLICRKCGQIEDADLLLPERRKNLKSPRHFKVEEVSLRITGLCEKCRKHQP